VPNLKNERKSSCLHVPGIQPADVAELLEQGSDIVVLSRGIELRLETKPKTLSFLNDQGIEVSIGTGLPPRIPIPPYPSRATIHQRPPETFWLIDSRTSPSAAPRSPASAGAD
jgi:hypothetical protein